MSQTTATLLAGSFGVFGVLAGLVIERFLRSFGRLWCEPSDWKMGFFGPGGSARAGEVEPSEARVVEYSLGLDLFNGKEVPVGLRSVHLEFTCCGGRVIDSRLLEVQDRPVRVFGAVRTGDTVLPRKDVVLSVVNLPPRQWVSKELRGSLGKQEDVRHHARWQKVEFVGQRQRGGLFERKAYRRTIDTRAERPSWWRRWFGFE